MNVMLSFEFNEETLPTVLDVKNEKIFVEFVLGKNIRVVQMACEIFRFRFKHKSLRIIYVGVKTNELKITSFRYYFPCKWILIKTI